MTGHSSALVCSGASEYTARQTILRTAAKNNTRSEEPRDPTPTQRWLLDMDLTRINGQPFQIKFNLFIIPDGVCLIF